MRKVIVALAALSLVSTAAAQQRYQPNWASVDGRATPAWFSDAKFGIFIHWGAYSVPAYAPVGKYAEWYWNSLQKGPKDNKGVANPTWDFHKRVYGETFPYYNFGPMFRAEMFDPTHWADVFRKSGAKYVVLTSKHHDGYALWPSEHASKAFGRPWNSAEIGPKRDLLGDLTDAVRKSGVRMGFYYSLYEWYNPLWLKDRKAYAVQHMHPQFKDVVTKYKPSIIFADGEWDMPSEDWKAPELLAWLFNDSPVKDEVVINDRWGKDSRHKHGGYWTTEYTAGLENATKPWEESRGMAHSYGYNRAERATDYRTDRELVLMLVDLISRGGNFLLDIGPTADGRIPVIMEQRLLSLGKWMDVNGEAIYESKPWVRTRQWSDGEQLKLNTGEYMTRYEVTDYVDRKKPGQAIIEAFFTQKGSDVYAIIPGWPGKEFLMKGVKPGPSFKATMLGRAGDLQWAPAANGVLIQMPEASSDATTAQYAHTLRLTGLLPR